MRDQLSSAGWCGGVALFHPFHFHIVPTRYFHKCIPYSSCVVHAARPPAPASTAVAFRSEFINFPPAPARTFRSGFLAHAPVPEFWARHVIINSRVTCARARGPSLGVRAWAPDWRNPTQAAAWHSGGVAFRASGDKFMPNCWPLTKNDNNNDSCLDSASFILWDLKNHIIFVY